jgi:cyclopropane-fatty-acyl-phospholipid synthase
MNKKSFLKLFDNIQFGEISIIDPDNNHHHFKSSNNGPVCDFKINDWRMLDLVSKRGDIGLGEAYMEEMWDSSDVSSFLCFLSSNIEAFSNQANGSLINRILFFFYNNYVKANTKFGSKKNILAHYDLGNEFYSMWLDPTMTYSSCIRKTSQESLEEAQINKYQRIIDRLNLDGANTLEIGCG